MGLLVQFDFLVEATKVNRWFPLLPEQGSWSSVSCNIEKRKHCLCFSCQAFLRDAPCLRCRTAERQLSEVARWATFWQWGGEEFHQLSHYTREHPYQLFRKHFLCSTCDSLQTPPHCHRLCLLPGWIIKAVKMYRYPGETWLSLMEEKMLECCIPLLQTHRSINIVDNSSTFNIFHSPSHDDGKYNSGSKEASRYKITIK